MTSRDPRHSSWGRRGALAIGCALAACASVQSGTDQVQADPDDSGAHLPGPPPSGAPTASPSGSPSDSPPTLDAGTPNAPPTEPSPEPDPCGPVVDGCQIAPGTPVYGPEADEPLEWEGRGDGTYYQPKWGADAYLGGEDARFDGYSVVISFPGQPVLANEADALYVTPGIYLENGMYVGNGYTGSTSACTGTVWAQVFIPRPDGSLDTPFGNETDFAVPCPKGLQFRVERQGTEWVFSYRVVGGGGFIEQGRYDVGDVVRAVNPFSVSTGLYDFDDIVPRVVPITYEALMLKADDGLWHWVDRAVYDGDVTSPYFTVRPEPGRVGLTTSEPGLFCYAIGEPLWDSGDSCYAQSTLNCNSTTGRCN